MSGISKSELYVWAAAAKLKVKRLGCGSKPQMRTCFAWVVEAVNNLPSLGD